jgi:hypothetical protein
MGADKGLMKETQHERYKRRMFSLQLAGTEFRGCVAIAIFLPDEANEGESQCVLLALHHGCDLFPT